MPRLPFLFARASARPRKGARPCMPPPASSHGRARFWPLSDGRGLPKPPARSHLTQASVQPPSRPKPWSPKSRRRYLHGMLRSLSARAYLCKARLTRVSSRPAWVPPARGSSPLWRTDRCARPARSSRPLSRPPKRWAAPRSQGHPGARRCRGGAPWVRVRVRVGGRVGVRVGVGIRVGVGVRVSRCRGGAPEPGRGSRCGRFGCGSRSHPS